MDAAKSGCEGCAVGVGDWPDVTALGRERGIGIAREGDNFMLASIEDCGEDDGTEAAGGSSNCDFESVEVGTFRK